MNQNQELDNSQRSLQIVGLLGQIGQPTDQNKIEKISTEQIEFNLIKLRNPYHKNLSTDDKNKSNLFVKQSHTFCSRFKQSENSTLINRCQNIKVQEAASEIFTSTSNATSATSPMISIQVVHHDFRHVFHHILLHDHGLKGWESCSLCIPDLGELSLE